jgi:hypothetical protein
MEGSFHQSISWCLDDGQNMDDQIFLSSGLPNKTLMAYHQGEGCFEGSILPMLSSFDHHIFEVP